MTGSEGLEPQVPPAPAPAPHPDTDRERRRRERRERRGGGLFGPILLIVVGLLFLASNLGVIVPISWGQLFRLWPVLLILAGIDLALGRRMPVLALVLGVLVVGGAVGLVAQYPGVGGIFPADGRDQISVPRAGAKSLDLRIAGGAAAYRLSGGATALVEASSDRSDLRLAHDRRTGDAASVRIEQADLPLLNGGGDIEVRVASDIPLSLRFDAGAGDFTLDLRDLRVSEVNVAVGAASVRLVLPRPQGEVAVRVSAGASSIVIENPLGADARVSATGALVSVRSEDARYTGSDREMSTAGYAAARDRLTVRVDAGASSVTLR